MGRNMISQFFEYNMGEYFCRVQTKGDMAGTSQILVQNILHNIRAANFEIAWYSLKRACPNKVMAHMWFIHDAHLGRAFLFFDILAEYVNIYIYITLLSMTVMATPCLWYLVGMKFVMSYVITLG